MIDKDKYKLLRENYFGLITENKISHSKKERIECLPSAHNSKHVRSQLYSGPHGINVNKKYSDRHRTKTDSACNFRKASNTCIILSMQSALQS